MIRTELEESFWTTLLPQAMETSSAASPYFIVYQAAQAKLRDRGFLSRDITVHDLLINRSDVHHVYPRNYLKGEKKLPRTQYNQIANFVVAQSELTSLLATSRPRVTSASSPSNAAVDRRSTAASQISAKCAPTCK